MTEFDLAQGQAAKEHGTATVLAASKEWKDEYLERMVLLPSGFTGLAEDFHDALRALGLPEPHHHNAWGAAFRNAIRKQIVVPTGEERQMRRVKSHARGHCPVMRKT